MSSRRGQAKFDGPHDAQGMVGLDQVNTPVHRLLIFCDLLVLAEGVGKDLNAQRVAAGDEFG